MTKPTFTLWGIDRSFDDDASLFRCLPVMFNGAEHLHPTRSDWSWNDDLPAYDSEAEARECAQEVTPEVPVIVPEGAVVLVMGPAFAAHLQTIDGTLPPGEVRIQRGLRLWLASHNKVELLRAEFSKLARTRLEDALKRALRAREEGHAYTFAELHPAHAVLSNAALEDRQELAIFDLIVADLDPDGTARFSRTLALRSARLRKSQELLDQAMRAKMGSLLRNAPRERAPWAKDKHSSLPRNTPGFS